MYKEHLWAVLVFFGDDRTALPQPMPDRVQKVQDCEFSMQFQGVIHGLDHIGCVVIIPRNWKESCDS